MGVPFASRLSHLSVNVIAQDGSHGRSAEAPAWLPSRHSAGSVPAGDPERELHAQRAAQAEPAAHGSAGVQGTAPCVCPLLQSVLHQLSLVVHLCSPLLSHSICQFLGLRKLHKLHSCCCLRYDSGQLLKLGMKGDRNVKLNGLERWGCSLALELRVAACLVIKKGAGKQGLTHCFSTDTASHGPTSACRCW